MLMGRTDMKDALERFDMLTREEAWMAIVRVMRAEGLLEPLPPSYGAGSISARKLDHHIHPHPK
jgi:hypothetical protein